MKPSPPITTPQPGRVPRSHTRFERFDGPVTLRRGETLPELTVAYETYGRLNGDRSNAVLVCHALTGDAHVARHDPDDAPGWWDAMVGPGRPIDTDRYFVIGSNALGGCRGTTGPASIDPRTGQPYGLRFPQVTVEDMVDVQARLLDRLGIDRLHAVVGGSMGGQQALAWAVHYPHRVRHCVPIATAPRLTSQALAFDVLGRNIIQTDAHFHQGDYYGRDRGPDVGLALARMLGHLSYLAAPGLEAKVARPAETLGHVAPGLDRLFPIGSYLAHQGCKFVQRFDANSYLRLSLAVDLFDLGATHERLVESLRPSACDWLIVSFSSDWLYPTEQSLALVRALRELGRRVAFREVQTDAGHDGFLLPPAIEQYGRWIAERLATPTDSPADELVAA